MKQLVCEYNNIQELKNGIVQLEKRVNGLDQWKEEVDKWRKEVTVEMDNLETTQLAQKDKISDVQSELSVVKQLKKDVAQLECSKKVQLGISILIVILIVVLFLKILYI